MPGERVLIVDDSSFMRKVLRKELEQAGFAVYEAVDGLNALQKAAEIRPHLITMDVDMPNLNGFDAVERIRSELKLTAADMDREVPIIFVTSNDSIEGRQKGFEVGATDFIVKPFLKGEIATAVKALIHPQDSLRGMTVLVTEDSATARRLIVNVLNNEGISTMEAENGKDALRVFRENKDVIDLVLTDFMMPEMNGDELCKNIRVDQGNRSLPVIFLSSLSEVASKLNMFKAGASDYVEKPFVKEELLARVKVHLEMRRLNTSLARQVNEHKRLNKLKDDILSVTSHDLRSPLNGILGFTDLLMADPTASEKQLEYLKHVKDSGDFLLNLINDILDIGRAQSENHELEMNVVSISELIEASVNTVSHMATPKEIDIEVDDRCANTPYILGDKNALIRIFNNLLSNAIKFTEKNGIVRQIIEEETDTTLKITVEDNGIGIPADKTGFLFDKFSKASRQGTSGEKSTGLGLSITKELVERHHGTITVSSKENRGTSFTIQFPLFSPESDNVTKAERPEETPSPVLSGLKVLVVDDNPLNIKLATKILTKYDFQIDAAQDGQEAVDCYIDQASLDNAYDAIFMDIQMPIMDGFEATTRIRDYELSNNLTGKPIFAMTAGNDEFWRDRCLDLGLTGTITKPIDRKQIDKVLRLLGSVDSG